MKLYKVDKWDIKITEIEVVRATDSSFWKLDHNKKERREARSTNYSDHFDTQDEAKNHLIRREEFKLKDANDKVVYYTKRVETAKQLFVKN